MHPAIATLSATSCLHLFGLPSIGDLGVSGSEFCGSFRVSRSVPVSRTNVPSVLLALLPSAEVSRFAQGSSMPRVERSLVRGRSSSSCFVFACLSMAAFSLIGLSFHFSESALMSSAAALACSTLGSDFFARGSTIGSLSRKRFARYLKISCAVLSFRMGHRIEIGTDV